MERRGAVEQAEEHLNRRDLKRIQRRRQHAIEDIERERDRVGGGRDYYARLLVEEANQCLDTEEKLKGANRGEIFPFRYWQDEQGIHTEEVEVEDGVTVDHFVKYGKRRG